MAKKKNGFSTAKIFYLIAGVLGVVAICMIALTSMNVKGSVLGFTSTSEFTGIQTTFGYKSENGTEYLLFSFMNLLPYIFVLVATLIAVAKVFGKMDSGLMGFIALGLFVAGGVLFLLNTQFTVLSESYANAIKVANAFTTTVTKSLGTGAIVSACCSFGGALAILLPRFVK